MSDEFICRGTMHAESGDASTLNEDHTKMLVFDAGAWHVVDLTTRIKWGGVDGFWTNQVGPALKVFQAGNILHWYDGRPLGLVMDSGEIHLGWGDTGEVFYLLPVIKPKMGADWHWRLNPTSQSCLERYVWVEKRHAEDDWWLCCVDLVTRSHDCRRYRDWLAEPNWNRARLSHETDWWGMKAFVQLPRSGAGFDAADYDKRAWVLRMGRTGQSSERQPYEHIAVSQDEYAHTGRDRITFLSGRPPIIPGDGRWPNHLHLRADGWITASIHANTQLGVAVWDNGNQQRAWFDVPAPPNPPYYSLARPVLAKDAVYWHAADGVYRGILPSVPLPPPIDPPAKVDLELIRQHIVAAQGELDAALGLFP